ncbi:MAG: hypothetical protein V9E96_13960 [Chitinophagaceae bacterium]
MKTKNIETREHKVVEISKLDFGTVSIFLVDSAYLNSTSIYKQKKN